MAITIAEALVECAPGNVVALTGSGMTGVTQVVIGNQLNVHADGTPATYDGLVTVAANAVPACVSFTVPDGLASGPLTATAGDSTIATTQLRVVGQYIQANEYLGEGSDISDLAPGELDIILRDASALIDSHCGAGSEAIPGFRLAQVVEKHKYRARPNGPPRFWVWRTQSWVSLDALVFLTSNAIRTQFNVSQLNTSDIFVNDSLGYLEILAYAFGNYVLLGFIETIGFSANVVEIAYTAGYRYVDYPAALRKATKLVATELLTQRGIEASGMSAFSRVRKGYQQYDMRTGDSSIPEMAKTLLRPFITRRLA